MNNNEIIKIAIADDHELIREGLTLVLQKEADLEIVGQASNGIELLQLVELHSPSVVLTDIVMPNMNGIEATKQIKTKFPETEVIALSMFDDQSLVIDMVEAGAIGYLLKNSDKSEIIEALHAAYAHEHYYNKSISIKLARHVSKMKVKQQSSLEFSPKELQVIRFICMEFTNEEIGKELFMSKRTVEGYRAAILQKMKVKGAAGIVIYAIQHNLYNPSRSKTR